MKGETILCVGYPDAEISELSEALELEGATVRSEERDERCVRAAHEICPSLVLVSPSSPGDDRFDWIQRLREEPGSREAAIVLLALHPGSCHIDGCRAQGADDCVFGPIETDRCVERLRQIIKRRRIRVSLPPGIAIEHNGIFIDTDRHVVLVDGTEVSLSLSEFQLLVALATQPGRAFTREELLQRMQRGGRVDERNIDVRIRSIRSKLGPARDLIVTVRGVGYKLAEQDVASPR